MFIREITDFQVRPVNQEEDMPEFFREYPCESVCSRLRRYYRPDICWHWHRTCELFYLEKGSLTCSTPHGTVLLPEGSGGLLNANVLHSLRLHDSAEESLELIHQFLPEFLSGGREGRIYRDCFLPFLTSDSELLLLEPEQPAHAPILRRLRQSFEEDSRFGAEARLRDTLSSLWLDIMEFYQPSLAGGIVRDDRNEKLRSMMLYIQAHPGEELTVRQLAQISFLSERECYRCFSAVLHTTPADYVRDYRLSLAAERLLQTSDRITDIACELGFGTASHFGHLFRAKYNLSPREYRLRQLRPAPLSDG